MFPSPKDPSKPLTERAANYPVARIIERVNASRKERQPKLPAASMHWLRHAHASHARDNGAPLSLVKDTLGHTDSKTTSLYVHPREGESSGRYLKLT